MSVEAKIIDDLNRSLTRANVEITRLQITVAEKDQLIKLKEKHLSEAYAQLEEFMKLTDNTVKLNGALINT